MIIECGIGEHIVYKEKRKVKEIIEEIIINKKLRIIFEVDSSDLLNFDYYTEIIVKIINYKGENHTVMKGNIYDVSYNFLSSLEQFNEGKLLKISDDEQVKGMGYYSNIFFTNYKNISFNDTRILNELKKFDDFSFIWGNSYQSNLLVTAYEHDKNYYLEVSLLHKDLWITNNKEKRSFKLWLENNFKVIQKETIGKEAIERIIDKLERLKSRFMK